MFNKEIASKIDALIKEKFPIIYDYEFDGIVLLYGGAIKNVIMDTSVHDLDFAVLTQGQGQILDFIYKYKLSYTKNAGGGYKIFYNGFAIDICAYNDLLDTAIYDIDLLFYDINKRLFITCGAVSAVENRKITEVNDEKNPLYSNKARLKKLIKFVKYVSGNKKRVRVEQNRIKWQYKMLKRKIQVTFDKTINGNFRKCFRFLDGCKKDFYIVVFLGLLVAFVSIMFPTFSGKLITAIMKEKYKNIFLMVVLLTTLKTSSIIISYILSKKYLIVRKKMVFNIRRDLAKTVLDFELGNFVGNNSGTFIDKLRSDPEEIARVFNDIKDILLNGLGNFGMLVYIFVLDYRIGFLFLVFLLIVFKIRITGIRKRKIYRQAYFSEQERYTGVLGELINGVSDIKTLNLKNNYMKRAEDSIVLVGENEYKGEYYRNIYDKVAYFVQHVAIGLVLLLGLFLMKHNLLSASSLVIIFMYNSSVFSFLEKLGKLVGLFSDLNISCDRIFKLLDDNSYATEQFGSLDKKKCDGEICFQNVGFRYKGKKNMVLDNCRFSVGSNETVAIVGKSGVGKTTIINLISRLYTVDDGEIKIDNVNINEYGEDFIRSNISVISQNPYLFDMSIKDNLRLVKEDVSDKEIIDVCKMVCMDDFIETLPHKYDTIIGEGGMCLSGGQKQRIGIARALLKDTKIILLDEITSALDNESSSAIKKVIKNIQKEHTIIIVTHELSLLDDSVRILVLDDGKIVGDGMHKDLIRNNEVYKKIYKIK